jgi:hypothetical protein
VARGRQRLVDYAAQPREAGRRYRSRRPSGAWRAHRVPVAIAATAAVAVAVAVAVPLASSGTGRQAQPDAQMSHAALTAAILTALNAAADDIVWDHTGPWVAYGQQMRWDGWAWPWEPRIGQRVLEHISYVNAPDTGQQYDTIIVQQPPAGSDADGVYGSLVRFVSVDYTSRTWQEATFPTGKGYLQNFIPSVAAIRAEIATGDWSVAGQGVVNGHQAIELRWEHGIGPGYGTKTGTLELWIDATTYLPLKQILNETGALKQYAVDTYQFLKPTPANLATFDVVIPPGFTKYTQPPGSWHRVPLKNRGRLIQHQAK